MVATKKANETVEQSTEPEIEEAPIIEKPKRSMPLRIEHLDLLDEFEGWGFSANRSFTFGELEELLSFNYTRMMAVLKKIVTGWDNFVDRDGNKIEFVAFVDLPEAGVKQPIGEFPIRTDPWRELTTDLLVAMTRAIVGLPSVPNR